MVTTVTVTVWAKKNQNDFVVLKATMYQDFGWPAKYFKIPLE